MVTYLVVLGRQPALGLAELEARFGAESVSIIQPDIARLETDEDTSVFDHLGGALKAAALLTRLEYDDWNKISHYLATYFPQHLDEVPEGKITLGISVHGLNVPPRQIQATALSLKKVIKQSGRSVRVVPNAEATLNTAQVLHNKLASPTGHELLVIRDGTGVLLARTQWVQDIEAYRRRDQERPARDSRVGMLPPKLAQIILGLAQANCDKRVLDPFCGTGVLLQEALLMGCQVYGSDIEPRMIEYSEKNLDWLAETHGGLKESYELAIGDAADHTWPGFDTIACETYLGRPFASAPDQQTLQKVIQDCNVIHKKFLQNVARQTKSGFRMCIAVPAWKDRGGFKHLPTLDNLSELGYNRVSFVHAESDDLIYHREGQVVARELITLIRK